MIKVTFYSVKVMADCEGRSSKVIARFLNEKDAERFAQSPDGRDMYKCKGKVQETVIDIYETISEASEHYEIETKRKALAKLTAEEKRVLGL